MKKYLILTLVMLLSTSTATAFYRLDPAGTRRFQSTGVDVAFPHALTMILPTPEWRVVPEGDREISLKDVSWGDEETWEEAVIAVAEQAESKARFNYTDKILYIKRQPPRQIPSQEGGLDFNDLSTRAEEQSLSEIFQKGQPLLTKQSPLLGLGNFNESLAMSSPSEPLGLGATATPLDGANPMVWRLAPGGLRSQIYEWAEVAGYQVVWGANKDYQISVSARFDCDFTSAIKTVFDTLYRSGHGIRVTIFEGNHVVRVWEE